MPQLQPKQATQINYAQSFPSLQSAYPSRETGRYYSLTQQGNTANINIYPVSPVPAGDFSRCGYLTCRREAIEMRSFPTLSFYRGSPSPRFTEIRDDFNEQSRRSESRAPLRRSPVRRDSPERASTSAQTQSTDSPQRREYRTGVQPFFFRKGQLYKQVHIGTLHYS